MLSNRRQTYHPPKFPLLSKEEAIDLLLEMITQSLLTFPATIKATFPEYADKSAEVIEGFFNQEFSHCLQITASQNGYGGYFTYHDESSNPLKLLNRGNRKGLERQVDLGIRLPESRERLLVVEGKRLHNPSDKQYVSGGTGGIARFKREQHGEDAGMTLACIVGYVQKKSFDFWHQKVNLWLEQEQQKTTTMKWGNDEKLCQPTVQSNLVANLTSNHQRLTLTPILLHHYWVMVN